MPGANGIISFCLWLGNILLCVYIYIYTHTTFSLSINLFLDLDCFHVLAVVNSDAMGFFYVECLVQNTSSAYIWST